MKKRTLACFLCIAMILALAACGSPTNTSSTSTSNTASTSQSTTSTGNSTSATEEVQGPDTLNVAMTASMGDIGPFAGSSLGRNNLRYFIYEYLATFSEFGQSWDEMEWQIAKDIRQTDETTYEFEIYDYVVDAIGNPVTASDVAFCVNSTSESGLFPRVTSYLESCTVLNDTTVEIKLKTTLIGALEYIINISPIVSEKTYTEHKDTMNTTPIGTGPYRVIDCVDGSSYTIVKNENYWQTPELANYYAKQPVNTMKYYVITEGSQATMALQTGDVDLITLVKNNELGYFLNADGSSMPGFNSSSTTATTPVELMFNMSEGTNGDLFRDNLPLRQAICYAINQEAIVNIAFAGYAQALHDISLETCGDYNMRWNEEDYYDYDVERAKELLVEAGYPDGKKDGEKVAIKLMVSSAYSAVAQVVQAQIKEIGFEVDLMTLDDAMFSSTLKNKTEAEYDIAIFKQGTEGYLTNIYDNIMLRDKNGIGAKSAIVDDELEDLLQTAHDVKTHNEESVDALHYYVKDNALVYGLVVELNISVAREGIIPGQHPWGYSCANISTFTK